MYLPWLAGGSPGALVTTALLVNNVRNPTPTGLPGAVGDGIADDTLSIKYWIAQGGLLWFPPGTYRHTATLPFTLSGTVCFGTDVATTSTLADDTGGNFGDCWTITNLRGCKLGGITIDAKAQRSAGAAIRINGGDSNYKLPGFNLALGGHAIDVDMNNQFDGVVFNDSAGIGDWDTVIGDPSRQAAWRNMASGSNAGVWFNTPNGGGQIVCNVFMTTKQLSDTPGPAVRYTAAADITLKSVKQIGMGGSLKVDCTSNPSPAGDGLIQANDCQFDSTSTGATFDNVSVNLGGGVTGIVAINFGNVWVAGATGNGVHITGNTTPLLMSWASGTCFSNGAWGVNGASHMTIGTPVLFSSNTSGSTTG